MFLLNGYSGRRYLGVKSYTPFWLKNLPNPWEKKKVVHIFDRQNFTISCTCILMVLLGLSRLFFWVVIHVTGIMGWKVTSNCRTKEKPNCTKKKFIFIFEPANCSIRCWYILKILLGLSRWLFWVVIHVSGLIGWKVVSNWRRKNTTNVTGF